LPAPLAAGAIVRLARALVSQGDLFSLDVDSMFGATPGMSLSPGFAGIHSGAAMAPIRDFSYNLRKLRKCQHMYLAETADRGLGVFAAKEFAPGDVVMMDFDGDYYEQVLSYRELCERSIELKYPLQVGSDLFRVPSGSMDDFTNHSCDPNTGIRMYPHGTVVLAIRMVGMHAEITFDYSTYLNNPYEKIRCRCATSTCRGIIDNFDTLQRELRQYYLALGIVGDFAVGDGGADAAEN
jgi:uncharacterized protein